jgi:hypothetical protein
MIITTLLTPPSGSPLLAPREASYDGTETDTAEWTHRKRGRGHLRLALLPSS